MENKIQKEFDTVKYFREVKEKISKETADMTFSQLKEYLKVNSKKVYSA